MRSALLSIPLALLLVASPASAQLGNGFNPGAGSTTPSPTNNVPENTQEAPESVKLFDSRRSIQGLEVDLGPVWYRRHGIHGPGSDYQHGTGELRLGAVQRTPWKPFYLSGAQETALRIFDSKSAAWSILYDEFSAGIALGPFEPEVRLGISLFTVDVFHGDWSVGLLSPRVAMAVGLNLGKFRLDIQGYSEYLWRWFGPDYTVRGITLGVRLEIPRTKPASPI